MTLRPARSFAFGLVFRGFLHFVDVVAHTAVAFVDKSDALEANLGAAEMAVMGAGILTVVELHVDHRGAFKANPDLDNAVLGGDFQPVYGGVRCDGRLAVGGGNILVAGLCALERAVFDDEGRDDFVPDLCRFGAFKVIGEKKFLFLGDWLGGDGGQFSGNRGSAKEEEGNHGETQVHEMARLEGDGWDGR